MQKTAINLIDIITKSNDKQECVLNIMQLMLVLKSLNIEEFEELKKYVENEL